VGRAPEQVDAFVAGVIDPIRKKYSSALGGEREQLRV
jgi:adenylosuccinate lyase